MKVWDVLTGNSLIHPRASFSKTFNDANPARQGPEKALAKASWQMTPLAAPGPRIETVRFPKCLFPIKRKQRMDGPALFSR